MTLSWSFSLILTVNLCYALRQIPSFNTVTILKILIIKWSGRSTNRTIPFIASQVSTLLTSWAAAKDIDESTCLMKLINALTSMFLKIFTRYFGFSHNLSYMQLFIFIIFFFKKCAIPLGEGQYDIFLLKLGISYFYKFLE